MNAQGICVAAAVLIGSASMANAAPLELDIAWPDISVAGITIDYNAGSGSFVAGGTPLTYTATDDDNVPDYSITDGAFSLLMDVNPATSQATGGSLSLSGTITELGLTNETLLTGTLTDMGFDGDDFFALFEFVFNVDGGALASEYGPVAYVVMTAFQSTFGGDFSTSFGGSDASADVARPIPEPTSMALVLGAAAACGLVRRRRTAG